MPNASLNLGVKLVDFSSEEIYLVLDLISKINLNFGKVWLERHEP